jgi:hypothetical protein
MAARLVIFDSQQEIDDLMTTFDRQGENVVLFLSNKMINVIGIAISNLRSQCSRAQLCLTFTGLCLFRDFVSVYFKNSKSICKDLD